MSYNPYPKRECLLCGRRISTSGLAQASHKKAHVKQGLMSFSEIFHSNRYWPQYSYTDAGQARMRERRVEGKEC